MTDSDPPLPALVQRARALAGDARRVVLGVTGPPGAGKSTVVEALLERLCADPPAWAAAAGPDWVAHVPMDGFHLADVQLARRGLLDRKGAPDTFDADGYVALLQRLLAAPDAEAYAPAFERELGQPLAAALHVSSRARLVLTEGNYLLLPDPPWSRLRDLLAETWYLDLDPSVRRERLTRRHERFGKSGEDAVAWATGPDESNAALVAATAGLADLRIRSG